MTYLGNLTYESVLFYYSSDVLRSRSQSSFFPLCFFFFLVLDRIDNVFAALTIHYMVGCKKHCPPCSWYGVYCSGYQKHRSDRLLIYEEMPRLRERPCVRLPYMVQICSKPEPCKSIYGTQKGAANTRPPIDHRLRDSICYCTERGGQNHLSVRRTI